jgi:S-phase kinase-associated protein 1
MNTVPILTNDKGLYNLPRKLAEKSIVIKNLIEDLGDDLKEPIPLPAVDKFIMDKILQYFDIVKDEEVIIPEDYTKRCDVVFNSEYQKVLTDYGWKITAEILKASNFLDIKSLQHSCAKNIGSMLIDKTYEELMTIDNGEFCKMLNIEEPDDTDDKKNPITRLYEGEKEIDDLIQADPISGLYPNEVKID